MELPKGPEHVCLDATVLIHYQDNGHLDTLRDLLPGRKFTPNVVTGWELVKTDKAAKLNERILKATWLEPVPVDDPAGISEVATLRALWNSRPDKNHGEAEVVVLCQRHGWVAIMDDRDGRGAAHDGRGVSCAYMSTMLIAATALGINGLDADAAWKIHQAVESKRKRPRVQSERAFRTLVTVFGALWQQSGKPDWPQFLTEPRLDQLVDRADPLP
jgi:hypothetical protein